MDTQQIVFGAGCFWGVQYYFDQIPGVVETNVGYAGGHTQYPTYEDVCYKDTGHAEVVMVTFDELAVSTETLVRHFFRMHDPTQLNRQGPDIGTQYRSTILYYTESQRLIAERMKHELGIEKHKDIVTEVARITDFYSAEAYHQKFTERTGIGMCHIEYAPL